jgi:hypothetical protein
MSTAAQFFYCDSCGKLKPVLGRRIKFVLARRTYVCSGCGEFLSKAARKEPKITKPATPTPRFQPDPGHVGPFMSEWMEKRK